MRVNATGPCFIRLPVQFPALRKTRQRLDALAEALGKSRSYVSRKFHAETGEKIHDYLNTLRLRKACECLLHSDVSVREIAARVGFSDVTWFISAFKKGIGETPLRYRKNRAAPAVRSGAFFPRL